MVQHTWKRLENFPVIFAVIFAVGICIPFIIALGYNHVSPYVPYISEGGGKFPEAGIFSICTTLSAILSQWIIILRYLLVEELNTFISNNTNAFLNKISLALGGFSTFSLIVVASFPTTTISQVHNSAAGATCVCYVIYLVCQTLISFRTLGRTGISYFRLVLTIFSCICLVLVSTFGLIASSVWVADYWPGKKTPQDKGFAFYVVSASSEWIMAFLLILFFSSYIPEFKKSILNFQLEITTTKARNKPHLSNLDIRHR